MLNSQCSIKMPETNIFQSTIKQLNNRPSNKLIIQTQKTFNTPGKVTFYWPPVSIFACDYYLISIAAINNFISFLL